MEQLNDKIANHESDQVSTLQEQVHKLQDTIEKMQDYSRKNTLEIHGIPMHQDEDKQMLLECIKDIGKYYGINIKETHLDDYHRLPSLTSNPVIVKFSNRWVCNDLKQKRKYKGMKAKDIGFQDSDENIYINVSLTKEKGYLAKQLRSFCKNKAVMARIDDAGKIWMVKKYPKEDIKKHPKIKYEVKTEEQFQEIYNKIIQDTEEN